MGNLKPITQKQFLVTISDLPNDTYWTSVKGGKASRDKEEYNDGKEGIHKKLAGFITLESLTLMKPFDPDQDGAVIDWIKKQMTEPTEFSVAVQPVSANLVATNRGRQIRYEQCTLFDFKFPDVDRQSSAVANLEIVIEYAVLPSYG
jgi:hypothetical protein